MTYNFFQKNLTFLFEHIKIFCLFAAVIVNNIVDTNIKKYGIERTEEKTAQNPPSFPQTDGQRKRTYGSIRATGQKVRDERERDPPFHPRGHRRRETETRGRRSSMVESPRHENPT